MSKHSLIVLLVGVNLLLLAIMILAGWSPPAAYGQTVPLGQNYLMVAAEIRDGVDALYLIDLSQRRMHVFTPNRDANDRRIIHVGFRDLQRDFRGAN